MTAATTTKPAAAEADQLEHFQALAQQRSGEGPEWVQRVRAAALGRFERLGLPTKTDEEWRYTNPQRITRQRFELIEAAPEVSADQVAAFDIPGLDCHRLVFVNGRYSEALSRIDDLPAGVIVKPLSASLEAHHELIEHYFEAEGAPGSESFAQLNAAMFEDGLLLYVPKNVTLEKPVHVLNVAAESGTSEPAITSPRNILIAGDHARAAIVEQYVSLVGQMYLTNAVTHIDAGRGTKLEHYLIEKESPSACQVSTLLTRQQAESDVHSHTVLLGGKLVRNNVNPRLEGEHGHCLVNGLYVGADAQHMDNHMRVEHMAANCDSRQFYKGILSDSAHAVFSGRIYVERGSQKTDAKQENANLLLSPDAEATTKPQLEIFADDVKCTHGATVGEIDEQAVQYLMARGVPRDAARALMIYAFAGENLKRMELEPVQRMLTAELLGRLPQGRTIEALFT